MDDHRTGTGKPSGTDRTGTAVGPRGVVRRLGGCADPLFSLCTMLTDWSEYERSRDSFVEKGFTPDICEYLVVDNSAGNRADAFVSTNEFLQSASGRYVVMHHQDVHLIEHGAEHLRERLAELCDRDPSWAVCGNAGAMDDGWPAVCISHPFRDEHVQGGPFPVRVVSLDENLLVVRRDANLAVSRDLSGFHHYGADLCTVADVLGWSCYVIEFYLRHDSGGTMTGAYDTSRRAITRKYLHAFRPRWIHLVTHQPFYASGSRVRSRGAMPVRRLLKGFGLVARTRDFDDPRKEAERDRKRMDGLPARRPGLTDDAGSRAPRRGRP